MTSYFSLVLLLLLQATQPASQPAEGGQGVEPAGQPRTRLSAKSAYERALMMAENLHRRDVRAAELKFAADLDAALKVAMQNNNLAEANRINEERQQSLKRLQSDGRATADAAARPTTSRSSDADKPAVAAAVSSEARFASREALKARLSDSRWSWPDRQFGDRAYYVLRADGTVTAGWHNRIGWWIVAGDNSVVAQIGASSGPVLVLYDNETRVGHFKLESGEITQRQP